MHEPTETEARKLDLALLMGSGLDHPSERPLGRGQRLWLYDLLRLVADTLSMYRQRCVLGIGERRERRGLQGSGESPGSSGGILTGMFIKMTPILYLQRWHRCVCVCVCRVCVVCVSSACDLIFSHLKWDQILFRFLNYENHTCYCEVGGFS
ncbi:unnamed protein product [Boreogadus saida]